MADHSDDRKHAFAKLSELIKDIQVAMMTTVDFSGGLRARPMWTHSRMAEGRLYFFTHASAGKVDEVGDDAHVCLTYAEPKQQRYVSVSGTARLSRDRTLIEELWSPAYKAWFPKGKEDPDIAVLVVECARAEYWDAPSSKMVHLYGVMKASLTGKSPKPGDHAKLDMGVDAGGTAPAH
jgi:general stress protein 26